MGVWSCCKVEGLQDTVASNGSWVYVRIIGAERQCIATIMRFWDLHSQVEHSVAYRIMR
jgi:hypothetical protein